LGSRIRADGTSTQADVRPSLAGGLEIQAVLRGLADEVRQAMLGVEVADHERRRELDVLPGLAAGCPHGVEGRATVWKTDSRTWRGR
jgi:hypothetical protein